MRLYPRRINEWFDRQPEPRRLMFALIALSPGIFLTMFPLPLQAVSLVWVAVVSLLRAAYLCKLEYLRGRPPSR